MAKAKTWQVPWGGGRSQGRTRPCAPFGRCRDFVRRVVYYVVQELSDSLDRFWQDVAKGAGSIGLYGLFAVEGAVGG